MKQTVLLGVTSGIAAYKILDLIQLLKKQDIDVEVMMTDNAVRMVDPKEFELASGKPIYTNLFSKGFNYKTVLKKRQVDHIQLADKTDLLVITPATANIIAKLAHGIADDFLTTTALAVTRPIIIAPAMNVNMWTNPIVTQNVATLKKLGYSIIEPTIGMLACGYEGQGRLENISVIFDEILRLLKRNTLLKGKKILVTAGPTIEKIDDVRFITNKSSGKMGAAIAEAGYLFGADVLLLRAKNTVKPRYSIPEFLFETAEELSHLIKKHLPHYDFIYHTAAVSDFMVTSPISGKASSKKSLSLNLHPREKISNIMRKINPKSTLVIFKAEYGLSTKDLITKAREKLIDSNADVVVANELGKSNRGFETDTNEVFIVTQKKTVKKIPLASKRKIAEGIVEYLTINSY